jgi:hypothetical protein
MWAIPGYYLILHARNPLPKEGKVTLQDNLNHQQDIDLFSIFTGERIDQARSAIMEASKHALYPATSHSHGV